MEHVLDVYKRPYSKDFPVICMDESPKQLIEESKTAVAMKPGQEARVDYEYIRHGVINIFMANEPLRGKRFVEVTEFRFNRTEQCSLKFMNHIVHLSKDRKLKKVIESQPAFVLEKRNKVYLRLCSSIFLPFAGLREK